MSSTRRNAFTIALLALLVGCADCWRSNTVCGNAQCEGGETCETCTQDCGQCNLCGNGRCDNSETENCNTCTQDCPCPAPFACMRELTLPPRCVLPQGSPCPGGAQPTSFTFCMVAPGRSATECSQRFETLVTACARDQAAAVARAQAAKYTLQDGPCPACQ